MKFPAICGIFLANFRDVFNCLSKLFRISDYGVHYGTSTILFSKTDLTGCLLLHRFGFAAL